MIDEFAVMINPMTLHRSAEKNQDDTVSSEEHLADKAVLVDHASLLAICCARCLTPHLLHVLQHHVAMAVKRLHSSEQFSVVATRDQHLGVLSDGGLQQ